jgi:hypothetical protein
MLIKTKEQSTRYEDIEQEISFPYFGISKEEDDFGLRTYYTLLKIQYFPEKSYGQFILTRIKVTLNHGDSAFSASWDDVRIELDDCSAFVINGSTPFLPSSYHKEMRCMDEEVSEEEFNEVASSILAQYGSLQLI